LRFTGYRGRGGPMSTQILLTKHSMRDAAVFRERCALIVPRSS
jgi:hypothetical protein